MRKEVVKRLRACIALAHPPWDPEGSLALGRAKRTYLERRRPKIVVEDVSKIFADRLAKRIAKAKAPKARRLGGRRKASAWPGLLYCPSESRRLRTRQRTTVPQKIRRMAAEQGKKLQEAWNTLETQKTIRARARATNSFEICLRPGAGRWLWLWLKRKLGLLLACSLLAGCASTPTHTWVPMLAVAGTADVIATERGLNTPGVYEANPTARLGTGGRIAYKTTGNVSVLVIARKLHEKHPKTAWGVVLLYSVGQAFVALHNHRLTR